MRTVFRRIFAVVLLAAGLAACTDPDSGTGKVGIILPDTKTSARWATADIKYLEAAFDAAGVPVDVQNAQGDKTQFQTIADGMISSGVKVLMIVNLDSGTGKAVLDKARSAGIATIDYDRLTLDGNADHYVSFDNVRVGQLLGQGLVGCLATSGDAHPVIAELNGAPTDNNATLFAQGYNSVLDPRYADGTFVRGPQQNVHDWDNNQAATIFEQMLTAHHGIRGVLAANDGLANAAIQVLKRYKLNGHVPVTGQDATVQGLQNILAGDQCMTVYKPVKEEADAASSLAIALAKGQPPAAPREILLMPRAITRNTVKDVIADGYVTSAQLCTDEFRQACAAAGIAR
ncbi:sugar ABC transporter substrate-binding protein [Actinoplanes sp. TFC3]|uniref:sugar ABC transporter substrate-binding protein n=1 Tax=Actinoplanes sp. TFC3 TaxID=1710355 RepID=UPI00082B1D91|nr:substrate-binding domain-containing protein [Actinoplanes sp. TFC3]